MALKTITGIVKLPKDIINNPNLQSFSGEDSRGRYVYHPLLASTYAGKEISLIESDTTGYDFQVADEPRLYIRVDWLQALNIIVDWPNVPVDSKVRVRNAIGDAWISGYFAKYENSKIFIWSNGRTSWTTTGTDSYNYGALV